ncbi:unnamed protein product [Caenorhabditis auriculariae]|uniref:Uncharacterized protein n=1 Tax=Caenorhabditis auriculariae TaxID=2777116 RepID=A0A8S1HSK3_9PELO|nr:unnamed protein product [Caenorhabditis auriculariae]
MMLVRPPCRRLAPESPLKRTDSKRDNLGLMALIPDKFGLAGDVGNFFGKQYQNAKDLFANDQTMLEQNIERVKGLLTTIKEKLQVLSPIASDAQKATLAQVDAFSTKVDNFQKEVRQEGAAKFEENKSKWEAMVSDIFDKNGLGDIVKLMNSGSMYSFSAALLIPIAYMFFN